VSLCASDDWACPQLEVESGDELKDGLETPSVAAGNEASEREQAQAKKPTDMQPGDLELRFQMPGVRYHVISSRLLGQEKETAPSNRQV